jgi:hypothetical protein
MKRFKEWQERSADERGVWRSVTRRAVHEKRHKILSWLCASACLYVLRKEMRNVWLLLLHVRLLPHHHVGDVHG